ncbi:MAG: Gfo/Idh/MocA family oxidoreductase [Victivallaceae bacterium]|nr:Gfo/Idh/MocA family oxidoreductase [Victivallaceae bacterium]
MKKNEVRKVRYAIIGFGGIAENRIAKEGFACDRARFSPLKNAELVGVTDINPARKKAAESLNLKFYPDKEAIFADPGIDAVFVAVNNTGHVGAACAALAAGKHVIVEKPLATRVADARKMIEIARRKNLSLAVDHMMVHNARNVLARRYIKAGRIGEINDGCFHMEFACGYTPAEAATWRCSKIEEMGGPIGDVASHCFYVAEYLFNSRITGLAAAYYPKQMPMRAEDGAYIRFDLENGLQLSARVAFCERRGGLVGNLSNLGFEIYGESGVLRSFGTMFQLSGYEDEPYRIRLELEDAKGTHNIAPRKIVNIYQQVIERHALSILQGKPLNAEDGLHNLKCCLAAHRSAQNGGKYYKVR